MLLFGHSPTEIFVRVSVGENAADRACMLELRRFDQQIRALVLLRARADSTRDGGKPKGLHHKAMRRPEDRRIFTIGQDE
jgi:hypothetical protein